MTMSDLTCSKVNSSRRVAGLRRITLSLIVKNIKKVMKRKEDTMINTMTR